MRKEFQETKLLQLKLIEFMIPIAKPTKREKNVIRNINKMKFYSLEMEVSLNFKSSKIKLN